MERSEGFTGHLTPLSGERKNGERLQGELLSGGFSNVPRRDGAVREASG